MSLVLRINVRVFRTFSASRLAADRGDADDGDGVAPGSAGSLGDATAAESGPAASTRASTAC